MIFPFGLFVIQISQNVLQKQYYEWEFSGKGPRRVGAFLNLFWTCRKQQSWVRQFCSKTENRYLCEVNDDFITDSFNLYGISSDFHLYREALDIILNNRQRESRDGNLLHYNLHPCRIRRRRVAGKCWIYIWYHSPEISHNSPRVRSYGSFLFQNRSFML